MKLLLAVRAAERPEEAAAALAAAAGLAPAEARMRLAPEPPALLARLAPERADAVVATLRRAGLAALAMAEEVPTDRDRLVAREVALGDAAAAFTSRGGERAEVPWSGALAVLRGARATRSQTERTERARAFSLGRAVATGGAILTRRTERTVRSSEESIEQVILVYPREGRAILLADGQLDFSCLGPALQPSATANVAELARRLRDGAKGAFYDERLLRLGRRPLPFVASDGWSSRTASAVVTRSDTRGSLDVLAEAMRRALVEGLLP